MKKVALVTIFDVPNYGSVLQTYATIIILKKLGCNVTTINYTRKNSWVCNKKSPVKVNIIKSLLHYMRITTRGRFVSKLNAFINTHLNLSKPYNSLLDLQTANWDSFDLFVTGSDQVWNTRYMMGDSVYLLSFVPLNAKRISIASSFAMKKLPNMYLEKYKLFLSQYSAISVREQNGIDILENQIHVNVKPKLILDPTLLLTAKKWLEFSSSKSINEPYILFYMLEYAFNSKPYIYEVTKYFKSIFKCRVLALKGYKRKSKACGLEMVNVGDSSVSEFIELFAHAKLVITSSFHGTAFALNFGVPLVSVVADNGDDRQISLMRSLKVDNCAVIVNTEISTINPYYNVENVQKELDKLRKDSLDWIQTSIYKS